MSQHDTLTQALQQIADWNSHTTEYTVDYGSNGVRDFYRNIARAALSATQPAQAAQSEPKRPHVGDSKFESWYQAHPKANGGDKQLARDAYAAGMFDPVAQGAGEVVAWQASDGGSSYISNEARSRNSAFRELYTIPLYIQPAAGADALKNAARYGMLRRGQHWSVINGIGDTLRGDALDAAADAALATHQQGGK